MRDWERAFANWATGPSATEQEKAENAERQIRQAILDCPRLRLRDICVFTQGSYRNRVNVRRDSDVDIGVLCFDTYFPYYPDDNVKAVLAESTAPASYIYSEFKNDLERALVRRFGRTSVVRGSKAFDVKANSYRLDADVAAFFEHRRYDTDRTYISGVEMIPDDLRPERIRNWPEQHYQNGVAKNALCGRRFKRMVRVLKTLSNEMAAAGIKSAEKAPSFLIECLVWNTPNHYLMEQTYFGSVRSTLAFLFNNTIMIDDCESWGEVSELKYLFRASQPWTIASANKFIDDAWNYIGYS